MLNFMYMKYVLALIAVLLVIGGGAYLLAANSNVPTLEEGTNKSSEAPAGATVVTEGSYAVTAEESRVEWAGKKPFLEGYINTGSIAVTGGNIVVAGQDATGEFTLDMDTLSVSATPTKPGQENSLEGHLKGERWFDVSTYPTASFTITSVSPRENSVTSYMYEVQGELTLKGQAHPVTFPAMIYQADDGRLHAHGELEIDRTKWGITSGSANFFDNVADNAIDDMVALSFALIAEKQ